MKVHFSEVRDSERPRGLAHSKRKDYSRERGVFFFFPLPFSPFFFSKENSGYHLLQHASKNAYDLYCTPL